jgi:ATP-dependent Clp protease ATP-binding subunit ClpX
VLRASVRPGRGNAQAHCGLRSILEAILLDTMFDLPGMDGVDEVMIDKDVVEGRKEPIRVYAEKKKDDAAA